VDSQELLKAGWLQKIENHNALVEALLRTHAHGAGLLQQ
jgi:hypothetical protein